MKTLSASEIKNLVGRLNDQISVRVSGYSHSKLSTVTLLKEILDEISNYVFLFDPKTVLETLQSNSSGQMNINLSVSDEIFLSLSWYEMESGNIEIVSYVTSSSDAYKEPFTKVYTKTEKIKVFRLLNKNLAKLPQYFQSKNDAFSQIKNAIISSGFDSSEFDQLSMSGNSNASYGISLSNRVYLAIAWHQMESGRYEVIVYTS